MSSFLATISDPHSVITPQESGLRFPEIVPLVRAKYEDAIMEFAQLVAASSDSADLLHRIRVSSIPARKRMAFLKIFRRCVAGVIDTEMSKKITTVTTASLVQNYGAYFKPISVLKKQFASPSDELITALAVAIGEYDNRGQQGYALTGQLFNWFEAKFNGQLTIEGPRGAGKDVELCSVIPTFTGSCPCDFIVREHNKTDVIAVGFARYDSTRGGAQSDDRTGGNAAKVYMIQAFCKPPESPLRIVFVADGPGLTHGDTWAEAVKLDGSWNDNVRVATLKLLDQRISLSWLRGGN
jgi:hypothetical protein